MPSLSLIVDSPSLIGLLLLAAFFVGASKGGLPGIGMLAVPVLSLVMSPVNAAVLLLPIFILSDTLAVWLYRKEFSLDNIKILIPAGLLGVGIGWATASLVSDDLISLLIGMLGVTFCLSIWLGNRASRQPTVSTPARGMFWGTLSGFTSFVAHAGAPPYQIYLLPQRLPKMVFAGTTTIVFAAINLAKFIPYANLHPYSSQTLTVAMALVPAAILGTMVGRLAVTRLGEVRFFQAVQIALFLICVKLIADYFNG